MHACHGQESHVAVDVRCERELDHARPALSPHHVRESGAVGSFGCVMNNEVYSSDGMNDIKRTYSLTDDDLGVVKEVNLPLQASVCVW